jgi:hypothetical protein
MSSLWTPGGEHEVPREPAEAAEPTEASAADVSLGPDDEDAEELARAQAALKAELDAARQRVAEAPAAEVVANHAMGLYELAAIHLSQQPPHLEDASLAIDALGALVDSVGDRLGEPAPLLRDALHQIRLAYVQLRSSTTA